MAHRLHQRARPAAIQMLAVFSFREDRPQVERVGGIAPVVVDGDVVLEFGRAQLLEERGGFRRTRTVIKPETFSLRQHLTDHRHERRNADAAGYEQKILSALWQLKIIDRRAYHQFIVGFYAIDQIGGAAAAIDLALDRDGIAIALGRVIAQRIFSQRAVRYPDRDMRAG